MKRITILSAIIYISLFLFCPQVDLNAQSTSDVLEAMELANRHFIDVHPNAGAPTYVKKMRTSNLWTRGVYFEGLYELIQLETEGSEERMRNEKYVNDWGTAHRWSPRDGVKTNNADNYCCCQTYLRVTDQIQPTIDCMDNLLSRQESLQDWTWVDAIQMGLPVLTRLSMVMAQQGRADFAKYAEQGWKMYSWTRNELSGGLFNQKDGLWWRDKDFVPPYTTPGGKHCYWSRGNGWAYAALVRAMSDIKEIVGYDDHYNAYKADFLKMTEALLKCQRKDLFWNASLCDVSDFGGKELTGTALFVYGMAWGLNNNILPEKPYRKLVVKTWSAMVKSCLHKDGFLGFVQGTGKQPSDSQPVTYTSEPDFDDFGLGCFLLAGSQVYKLLD